MTQTNSMDKGDRMRCSKFTSSFVKSGLIALAIGSASATAQAQFFVNTFGLASPVQTVTFSELTFAQGTTITNQYAAFGVSLSPGIFYNSQGPVAFPGITGDYLGNNVQGLVNPFSILFGTVQSDAAFGAATNPTTTLFEALLAGNIVASGTSATDFSSANAYYGFSGVNFDEIRMTVGGDQQMLIDNVQMGSAATVVPEPGTFALLAAILIPGAAVIRRRRRFTR